ncbi:MAG TPA: TetR/AcrR family transcriptional regulator [Solirubrobacteraceae bacterium]|jgi:AcrR family transcriptional regulator
MGSTDEMTGRASTPLLRPGPGGLSRRRVAAIQRARILVAATDVLEEAGYSGMTVAQVIGRAKVSRKTFYDLFADRQDCFLEVLEETIVRIRGRVEEAYARESRWRDGVRSGLAGLLGFLEEEPALARICLVEAQGAGMKALERRARIFEELADVVDRGRSATSVAREPPEITAEGIVGAVFVVLQTRLFERNDEPFMELLSPLMSMVVLPYLGARAAHTELARRAEKTA